MHVIPYADAFVAFPDSDFVTANDGTVDTATITYTPPVRPFFGVPVMAPPDGLEPPTQALGRPRSVH